MALWLVRTGGHNEHEQRFLSDGRIYLTWDRLKQDMSKVKTPQEFQAIQLETYPDQSPKAVVNYASQARRFVQEMQKGDWVVVPSKKKAAISFAEITGPYVFDREAANPYYHYRTVKWIAKDVPRSHFDQDLLYSFGAFSTICQIQRNDAENRVRAMAAQDWKSAAGKVTLPRPHDEETNGDGVDLELLARDQIAKLIIQRFKGHGLERLVEAVLQAQGYTTYHSPEGADKGIDILAAPGPLGFGRPRICVQVKSEDRPIDRATLDQLIGTMQNVQADQGLLVSWSGFKSSVDKEIPAQFFRVRLWDQDALIDELLANYDKLSEDLRAELPLKRIWTLAMQEEAE